MRAPPRVLWGVLPAVLAATAAGCGAREVTGTSDGLDGRTFLSTSITEDGAPRLLVEGTRIRLAFSAEDRLTASAGCNTMGATFELDRGRIVVGDLSTTEMGCDPERHAQDQWLATLLADGPAYTVDGDHLELRSDGTVVVLLARRVAEPGPTARESGVEGRRSHRP